MMYLFKKVLLDTTRECKIILVEVPGFSRENLKNPA